MKLFVSDFHRQLLQATEILASDWLRANLSVKIINMILQETLPTSCSRKSKSMYICKCGKNLPKEMETADLLIMSYNV